MIYRIWLSQSEFMQALFTGLIRYYEAVLHGRRELYGRTRDPLEMHFLGCCGERCVAKFFDVYCTGQTEPDYEGDIGEWQVRTNSWDKGKLLIYPRDNDEQRYILVTGPERRGAGVEFVIRGYYLAGDAKKRDDWRNFTKRGEPWEVPQDVLLPLDRDSVQRR